VSNPGKNYEQNTAAQKSTAIILRERSRVVIIREFRTFPAHRLFCFAASRPSESASATSKSGAAKSPRQSLCEEMSGQ
jgi:hypothetical protein